MKQLTLAGFDVECPVCGVSGSKPCVNARGRAKRNVHKERIIAAAKQAVR